MDNPSEMTNGQTLAKALQHYFSVGPRTRRYRDRRDLHREMIETVILAGQDPLQFGPAYRDGLRLGFAVGLAYEKHVGGSRICGTKIARIQALTPFVFAKFLGEMVDAGVTNGGLAEKFFRTF